MSSRLLKMNPALLHAEEIDHDSEDEHENFISLESISESNRPAEDFRILVSNLQTIEETMTAKAKTVSQKTQLLITWEKLKGLLYAMTDRLEKDIENARRIERHLEEAKEKSRDLQMKTGAYNRFN